MKKISLVYSFVLIFCLVFNGFATAGVIEGKLISLDPVNKLIKVKQKVKSGAEQEISILVPDGTLYKGNVPSIVDLKAGTDVLIIAKVGNQPGTWIATEIKQLEVKTKPTGQIAEKVKGVQKTNQKKVEKTPIRIQKEEVGHGN